MNSIYDISTLINTNFCIIDTNSWIDILQKLIEFTLNSHRRILPSSVVIFKSINDSNLTSLLRSGNKIVNSLIYLRQDET